jgi:hypothetical protein
MDDDEFHTIRDPVKRWNNKPPDEAILMKEAASIGGISFG